MIGIEQFETKQKMMDYIDGNPKSNTLYYSEDDNVVLRTNNIDGTDTEYEFWGENEPLTIEATDGATDMYVYKTEIGYEDGEAPNIYVRYLDLTTNEWSEWERQTGSKSYENTNKVQIKGDNPNGFSKSNSKYTTICFTYINQDRAVKVSGNILSLLGNYLREIPNSFCFANLFYANVNTSATFDQTLDLSELQLPTTTVEGCYYRMLYNHSSNRKTTISQLPDLSQVENVARSSFNGFYQNQNLSGNQILFPNVSKFGYAAFNGYVQGTDITEITIPNVEMDYATFNNACQNCTSLTEAILLPKHSTERCYYNLFKGCTSLTKVTMHLEDVESTDCLKDMFSGVTTEGVLYVPSSMVENEYILSVLPETWTISPIPSRPARR